MFMAQNKNGGDRGDRSERSDRPAADRSVHLNDRRDPAIRTIANEVARDLDPFLSHGSGGPSGEGDGTGVVAPELSVAHGRGEPVAALDAGESSEMVSPELLAAAGALPARKGGRPLGRGVRGDVWTTYKERVCHLSERLVKAQKPIRILDAIKWTDDVFTALFKNGLKKLPNLGRAYYQKNKLRFDPDDKIKEFASIAAEVEKLLGADDDLGRILLRNCREYQQAVKMLKARGTPDFHKYSRELYGSPKDLFMDGETSLRDLGHQLYEILDALDDGQLGGEYPRTLSAEQCVHLLNRGFEQYFHDHHVHARLDDGVVSDAAAGADYVKVKRGVQFSTRDVEILEVHEGWVHVGTTLNGQYQRIATWLAKGPPCTTSVQEGLAVLMELITFVTLPVRAKKLNNRILAIDKAEDGADLFDIIEFYRTEGYSEPECIVNAQRVFRGGVVKGGAPFTKDISYCKGFVSNYNFLRSCIRFARPELIPFIFVGKVTLEDIPVLYQKWKEGVVDPPKYVPRHFRDLNGLAMWMAYSNFFNRMKLANIQERLKQIILGA